MRKDDRHADACEEGNLRKLPNCDWFVTVNDLSRITYICPKFFITPNWYESFDIF